MATAQLILNGQTFPLPHKALLEVAGVIAERAAAHPDLYNALFALNIPSVTQELANRLNINLHPEMADRIWQQGDRKTRTRLLQDWEFLRNLSCEQVDDILNADDEKQLAIIAKYFEFNTHFATRLDSAQIDALYARLVSMPNRTIRKALADNDDLPDGAEDIGLEERIALNALRTSDYRRLSPQDVELFRKADSATLDTLTRFVDMIRSGATRRAVMQLFLEHDDPTWRQDLAGVPHMTRECLRLLAGSDDTITAAYAEMTLEAKDED